MLASLCTPPEADEGGLPGNTRCQRRFRPQRSSWTPLLTLPGKNNPARRQSKEGGSSAFHPQEYKPAPPKARAAPGEDAPVQAAGGSWLQPSCQTPAKPFPHQECPQQPPSPYQGQHCPRAAPSLSQVTHQRNLHHSTIPVHELTRPRHRVRTLHPREMSALRNKLHWETTSLLTCSSKHTSPKANAWVWLLPDLEGRSGKNLR